MSRETVESEGQALRAHGQALLRLGRELLERAAALEGEAPTARTSLSTDAEILENGLRLPGATGTGGVKVRFCAQRSDGDRDRPLRL